MDDTREPGLRCPRCLSDEVHRLPPDWVSPRPGYRCLDCGRRMSSRNMRIVYLGIMALALAVLVLSVGVLLDGGFPLMLFIAPVILLYCGWQYTLPLPIQDKDRRRS